MSWLYKTNYNTAQRQLDTWTRSVGSFKHLKPTDLSVIHKEIAGTIFLHGNSRQKTQLRPCRVLI